jgi:hypothetical protein
MVILTMSLGQIKQWKSHHKKICKSYYQFASSDHFQSLTSHEKLDSILLTQLLCQFTSTATQDDDECSPISIFRSLLPGPDCVGGIPSLTLDTSLPAGLVDDLYSRFGNNNFAIHSHLTSVGHGIFPLASRLFNHSCVPNAAAKYIFSPIDSVRMEVVALRDIDPDEEVGHRTSKPKTFIKIYHTT